MTMRNKSKFILPFFLIIFLCCCAETNEEQKEIVNKDSDIIEIEDNIESSDVSETEEPVDESQEAETKASIDESQELETLRFVDALGEWFEATINPNIEKHDYKWECLTREGDEVTYIGDQRYYIKKGVDVSHHQGDIDWNKVKADGYDFAIVRIAYRGYGITTGDLYSDREYYNNIIEAQKAGLDVGVYVFSQAINEEEALEEAELVIDSLEGLELQLPVVFDPELIRDDTARTDDVTGEQFTKNTIAFCERIKEAGYVPMIYSNMYWEAFLFDLEQLSEYAIWYADYEKIPQTPYDFTFWQYSESGTVDGIQGVTDLNVWFIPYE